ncbi:uncharacterized protein LTR77_004858 [Saxophila tyrrhenica]|uniref:Uncharacterized protein n=1 Tax=Saxophila tyrrhenica TaxID=1690608 RepID=A0AAV9PAE1_9PEZI|nr:hypothetical protein LTR77_004858 [Saxophila tyrrhenica]
MSQYMPPTDQQLPPRPRAVSGASVNKYHPEHPSNLQPPTPQPSAPMAIPSRGQPPPPALGGQPIQGTPPVPNAAYYGTPMSQPVGPTPPVANANYYGSSPGYFGPQTPQLHPGYPGFPSSGPPTFQPQAYRPQVAQNASYPGQAPVDPNGYMRPVDPRRPSASSTHSRHSGKSRHSHGRRDSHQPRRRHSEDSYDDDDMTHDERRERDRRHSAGPEVKPVKRTKTHRPTLGDSVYSMFGVIKDALGPRDKPEKR